MKQVSERSGKVLEFLHCALSLAAQCIVIGPVCGFAMGRWACGRCLLPQLLEIACIDFLQTGSVGEGSDHLQLIKFWPPCVPAKGVCGWAKIFGSALLRPARSVCVSPSAFSCYFVIVGTLIHSSRQSKQ